MDKGLTVSKWVLINRPKIPQMPHRAMRAKNFPFLYEDGPRAVMGVK